MQLTDADRTTIALYWAAWTLRVCDGLPLQDIAAKLNLRQVDVIRILALREDLIADPVQH